MRFTFETMDIQADFLHYLQHNRRMSINTVQAYENDLSQFTSFCENLNLNLLAGLKLSVVRSWMAELSEQGISARSIHRKISALRSFSRYLRKNGHLTSDPLAKIILPKMPRRILNDIPAQDLQNMFRHFPWDETEEGQRDKLLLLLFYTTGMRLSELTGLKVADIDFYRQSLKVTGKRNKQRVIPLHPEISELLKVHISGLPGHSYLFTGSHEGQLSRMTVYRLVTKYLKLFSSAMKTSPHILRHSFATHMLNNGAQLMAIKEILGHTSLNATQVYTKNSFEKLKKIHSLHPRNN